MSPCRKKIYHKLGWGGAELYILYLCLISDRCGNLTFPCICCCLHFDLTDQRTVPNECNECWTRAHPTTTNVYRHQITKKQRQAKPSLGGQASSKEDLPLQQSIATHPIRTNTWNQDKSSLSNSPTRQWSEK